MGRNWKLWLLTPLMLLTACGKPDFDPAAVAAHYTDGSLIAQYTVTTHGDFYTEYQLSATVEDGVHTVTIIRPESVAGVKAVLQNGETTIRYEDVSLDALLPQMAGCAPMDMLQAGFGDIVGKYSCLNDWKLSALINGEYLCQWVYDLTYETTRRVETLAEGVVARDEAAVGALMEALVVVGIAMSYVGNSRPASGSEHHLSHFFEITGILNDQPYFSHGIDVVYSAVATAAIREKILAADPHPFNHDAAAWEAEINRIYTTSAPEVIKLQNKMDWYNQTDYEAVAGRWEQIKAVLAEAPTAAQMLAMVERAGLDYRKFIELYGEDKIADAVLYAKDLKDRYSVLWLNYMFCR